MRRHPRLGLFLLALGLLFGSVGLVADGVGAETTDDDDAPVIGEDPADEESDPAADDAGDTADEELASTGFEDEVLTPMGVALILVGLVMTMFGQPASPRGRHSTPSTKLRGSFVGLAVASIGESVGSARRR